MRPGDKLVCGLVQPAEVGDTFTQWPLHVTVVPWFRLETKPEDLVSKLGGRLKGQAAFWVKAGREEHLSHRQVNAVTPKAKLMEVHRVVLASVHEVAKFALQLRFTGDAYHPHVTVQPDERLRVGDKFLLDRLYIIEQKGDYKAVMAVVELAGQ